MKIGRRVSVVVGFLLLAFVPLYADVAVSFDENGNGSFNGTPFAPCSTSVTTGCFEMVGAMPSVGFSGFLAYFFPAGVKVKAGDVKILEPGTTSALMSDGLRFTNAAGRLVGDNADRMFFFSDQADGINALADTGFPMNFYRSGNRTTIMETGLPSGCGASSEKSNGFCYVPSLKQPGGNLVAMGLPHAVQYNAISDVPESGVPFEMALGPCGVLLCGVLLRKRLA